MPHRERLRIAREYTSDKRSNPVIQELPPETSLDKCAYRGVCVRRARAPRLTQKPELGWKRIEWGGDGTQRRRWKRKDTPVAHEEAFVRFRICLDPYAAQPQLFQICLHLRRLNQ